MTEERYAPEGMAWVCTACGKISPYDRYGDKDTQHGWDVSCVMNSTLMKKGDVETIKGKGE